MNAVAAGVVVLLVQVVTGIFAALARKNIRNATEKSDLLAEITVGKGTVKFDKSDILAIAFSVFVFWGVGIDKVTSQEALTAFVAVITGTGLKEIIAVWFPTT